MINNNNKTKTVAKINDVHLKVKYLNQLRRFSIEKPFNFTTLIERICSVFRIKDTKPEKYLIKYVDEDGDEITLRTDFELISLLKFSDGVLRLTLVREQEQTLPIPEKKGFCSFPGGFHEKHKQMRQKVKYILDMGYRFPRPLIFLLLGSNGGEVSKVVDILQDKNSPWTIFADTGAINRAYKLYDFDTLNSELSKNGHKKKYWNALLILHFKGDIKAVLKYYQEHEKLQRVEFARSVVKGYDEKMKLLKSRGCNHRMLAGSLLVKYEGDIEATISHYMKMQKALASLKELKRQNKPWRGKWGAKKDFKRKARTEIENFDEKMQFLRSQGYLRKGLLTGLLFKYRGDVEAVIQHMVEKHPCEKQ